jgi:hypothetical protein
VQVIIKQDGEIVYRDSQLFFGCAAKRTCGAQRDKTLQKAIDDPEKWAELTTTAGSTDTLAVLIKRYQREYGSKFARTVGDLLARSDLAKIPVGILKSRDIVQHIRTRTDGIKDKGDEWVVTAPVTPATAANDLIRLQKVFNTAHASSSVSVPMDELEKARIECRYQRLVGKAKERERIAPSLGVERRPAPQLVRWRSTQAPRAIYGWPGVLARITH